MQRKTKQGNLFIADHIYWSCSRQASIKEWGTAAPPRRRVCGVELQQDTRHQLPPLNVCNTHFNAQPPDDDDDDYADYVVMFVAQ